MTKQEKYNREKHCGFAESNFFEIENKLTDRDLITILTALDIYYGTCRVIMRDRLEEIKEKVMSLLYPKKTKRRKYGRKEKNKNKN